MKGMLSAIVMMLVLATGALAQTKTASWEGYLVDKMCGAKMTGEKGEAKAMKHTKDCALEDHCKASGFGIVTGGAYVKFTDASDAKAVKFLEGTKMESNIYVKVTGTMDGEKLNVTAIDAAKKTEKKAAKKS